MTAKDQKEEMHILQFLGNGEKYVVLENTVTHFTTLWKRVDNEQS